MKSLFVWKMITVMGLIFLAACAGNPGEATQPAGPTTPQGSLPTAGGSSTAAGSPTAAIPVTSTEGAATLDSAAATAATAAAMATAKSTASAAPSALGSPTAAGSPTPGAQAASIDCTTTAVLTPAMTEGPYFKAGSPEATDLAGSLPGKKLHLTGYVLTPDCQPVANAKIEFWQADSQGQYDNSGYTLRGHQFTAADGSYQLTTVVPGEYPGRTEHIHVKVQAPNGPELTTQLFFPGVAHNQSDRIFDQGLLVNVVSDEGEMTATYNFVVNPQ